MQSNREVPQRSQWLSGRILQEQDSAREGGATAGASEIQARVHLFREGGAT